MGFILDIEKMEMLNKESDFIIKQITLYTAIWGSVIMFLFKYLDINIVKLTFLKEYFFIFLLLFIYIGIVLSNFIIWLKNSINRLKKIRKKMEEING